MKDLNPISEDDFTFICKQQWWELEMTADPKLRFCSHCQKHVHFISNRLDFDRYGSATSCVAVEREPETIIVGGLERAGYPSISRSIIFSFDFGSIANLSKGKLETIYWCKHLGARIDRQKKNRIGLTISLAMPEAFDRLVRILDKEGIEYEIVAR